MDPVAAWRAQVEKLLACMGSFVHDVYASANDRYRRELLMLDGQYRSLVVMDMDSQREAAERVAAERAMRPDEDVRAQMRLVMALQGAAAGPARVQRLERELEAARAEIATLREPPPKRRRLTGKGPLVR
jgi:hypothetical protein